MPEILEPQGVGGGADGIRTRDLQDANLIQTPASPRKALSCLMRPFAGEAGSAGFGRGVRDRGGMAAGCESRLAGVGRGWRCSS